jgi:type I restriction enzyme S subunit
MTRRTTIGKVAKIVGGSGFNDKYQGKTNLPIPFIKVSDFVLSRDTWLDRAANTVDETMLKEIGARTFPTGTIIFPKVGGALLTNKRARLSRPAAADNNIMGLIPEHIDPDYLFYFLLFFDMGQIANTQALPSVNAGKVAQIEIPFPEDAQQKAIAGRLNKQLKSITTAVTAITVQFSEMAALASQIIFKSLESPTQTLKLGDALGEIKTGIGGDWASYPVLGATRAGLAPAKERPGKQPERYKPVFPGTVFYNPMRIMIGSIAFVDDDDKPGITSPDYVALKGKPGVVDSRWFYHWLRSPLGEQCISSLARGAVRERMLFNRLAEGEIELPDFKVQEKASQALAQIKPMRAAIEKQMQELELMPQKLLAQVFES